MKSPKVQSLLTALSVVLVLFVNYYSQTGAINNQTVGALSSKYDSLFTPAGYAFAIWGLIFLLMIIYAFFQLMKSFRGSQLEEHDQTGYLFAFVNLGNASWVVAWLYDLTGLSVIIMLLMLIGLLRIVKLTNMEKWDAPVKTIAFFWWPVCIYAGWITVATIANISSYLIKLGWTGGPLSESAWTVIMIVIATSINMYMIWARNMREFALVGAWALFAIYSRHDENQLTIAYVALAGSIILMAYIVIHGYKNRRTNPITKLHLSA